MQVLPLSFRYVIYFTSPRVFLAMIHSVHIHISHFIPKVNVVENLRLITALEVLSIPVCPLLVEAVGDAR